MSSLSESRLRIRSVSTKKPSTGHPKTDLSNDRHRQSQLHDFDVLVQSGELSETQPAGNQNFQRLLQLNVALYEATKSPTERYYITQSIVRSIRHEGGRFLQYVSAWPRQATSSASEENDPSSSPDNNSIWILKEMTEAQAETFTGKALDEATHNRQQQQQQRRRQSPDHHAHDYFSNHNPNLALSPQQLYPRQQRLTVSTGSHRKPFRVLQPQNPLPSLDQGLVHEKHRLVQESRFADSGEYGNDVEVRQDNHEGIFDHESFNRVDNQENNPLLVNMTTATTSPPSPPMPLLMVPAKATWTVSPIQNQRKRVRVDAFCDSTPASPSSISQPPPLKRCRREDHDD